MGIMKDGEDQMTKAEPGEVPLFQRRRPSEILPARSSDPLTRLCSLAQEKSSAGGLYDAKGSVAEVCLSPKESLSFLCLYRSFARLSVGADGISLLVAKPDDINMACDSYATKKDPGAIIYPKNKAEVIILPLPVWEEIGAVLLFAGVLGDQFWRGELPELDPGMREGEKEFFERARKNFTQSAKGTRASFNWKKDGLSINIYASGLATQEAIWFYVNDSSLHLDMIGSYLLGEAILSFARGGGIDRTAIEKTIEDLIEVYYAEESESEENEEDK